jgi:copper chaperone CopZ
MNRLVSFIVSLGICSLASADTITATIKGTACDLCTSAIEQTFKTRPEVKTVDVDLGNGIVVIETKRGQTIDDARIKNLLASAGYTVVRVVRKKE